MNLNDIRQEILRAAAQVYVIVGPAGIGKQAFAEDLATHLLGTTAEHLATHPDFLLLQASEEGKRAPSMNDVRDVLSRLGLRSMFGHRVGIIPHADRLSTAAQNALLKTLEEPTPGTLLLLLSENEEELLPTIRSRAIVVRLPLPERAATVREFGESLTDAARGLPSLARHLMANDEARQIAQQARADAQLFLQAPLWKRLVCATQWTKEAKKKGGSIPLHERLLALEDVARLAVQAGNGTAGKLLAALPRAFADEQQNVNAAVIIESLAIVLE